jgi:hypothetical protein
MKKGTTVESGYDAEGRWHLKIKKAKGKFTTMRIQDTQLILLTTYRIYSKICVNAY